MGVSTTFRSEGTARHLVCSAGVGLFDPPGGFGHPPVV